MKKIIIGVVLASFLWCGVSFSQDYISNFEDEESVPILNEVLRKIWFELDKGADYDTGWIARSDWTAVHLGSSTVKNAGGNIVHNLGRSLSDLLVKVTISTDGTDENSFETYGSYATAHEATLQRIGYTIEHVDDNNLKINTGAEGLLQIITNGTQVIIDNEDWYYRIKVFKL